LVNRLIFVNRYFCPDHSATSQILSDLAFALAAAGRAVSVVTSQQRYDDAQARLPAQEKIKGVDIHRISTSRFGRSTLWGRAIDYLSFYAGAYRAIRRLARPGDIVVAKTDPPLLSVIAMRAVHQTGARGINWLQDLYPEVAVELGVPFIDRAATVLTFLRDRSLRQAVANVVLEQRMADRLRARAMDANAIHIIPNWCDDEAIAPISATDNPLRHSWGLADKFVVGYSGNLGRAHEFETALKASERLQHHPRVIFLMIGGGHQFEQLQDAVKARNLEPIWQFQPYQEQEALNLSLGVPDLHWISLKPALEGLIVPSKFYGIAAAGRPIIAITAADGDIARLVLQHDCGIVIEPGDSDRLAEAIGALADDPAQAAAMGSRARAMLEAQFTRQHAIERWQDLIAQIESQTGHSEHGREHDAGTR
jgi:colanic acid biosynthesis glycosyl transferase WcaI